MSKNDSTDEAVKLNDDEKKTLRFEIDESFANTILDEIDAPTPDASEFDEIVLVIKK